MTGNTFSVPLPPGFTLDDLARIEPHLLWDHKMVERRLVEAVTIAERATRNPSPKGTGALWPTWLYDGDDLAGQSADDNPPARVVPRFRINEMEEAILWQAKYLANHEGPARVLRTYLRCRAYRKSFSQTVKRKGWSRATAYRARDKALTIIAFSLMRDGIPPHRGEV